MEISSHDTCAGSFFKPAGGLPQGSPCRGRGRKPGSARIQPWSKGPVLFAPTCEVLEDMKGPIAVDSELPCPKEQIGKAILRELAEDPESDLRRRLEIAYVQLESFIPYEEYRVIEDFKDASLFAQQIADMGDPTSILRSARIIRRANGESAVRLQEKIHEKMTERQLQVLKLRESSFA